MQNIKNEEMHPFKQWLLNKDYYSTVRHFVVQMSTGMTELRQSMIVSLTKDKVLPSLYALNPHLTDELKEFRLNQTRYLPDFFQEQFSNTGFLDYDFLEYSNLKKYSRAGVKNPLELVIYVGLKTFDLLGFNVIDYFYKRYLGCDICLEYIDKEEKHEYSVCSVIALMIMCFEIEIVDEIVDFTKEELQTIKDSIEVKKETN